MLQYKTHGWGTGGRLKGPEYPPKGKNGFGLSRYDRAGKPAPFPGGKGRFGAMLVLHERPETGASVSNTVIVSLCTVGADAFAVERRTAIAHVYRLSDGGYEWQPGEPR